MPFLPCFKHHILPSQCQLSLPCGVCQKCKKDVVRVVMGRCCQFQMVLIEQANPLFLELWQHLYYNVNDPAWTVLVLRDRLGLLPEETRYSARDWDLQATLISVDELTTHPSIKKWVGDTRVTLPLVHCRKSRPGDYVKVVGKERVGREGRLSSISTTPYARGVSLQRKELRTGVKWDDYYAGLSYLRLSNMSAKERFRLGARFS